jgi:hypothetical protein
MAYRNITHQLPLPFTSEPPSAAYVSESHPTDGPSPSPKPQQPEVHGATRTRLGRASLTYIDSGSLLTPASGFIHHYKFTLNPYSGCGFGCEYCYARFFAPTLEEEISWGEWVKVKQNALELLQRAIRSKSPQRRLAQDDPVYMSTVTDPYQPMTHDRVPGSGVEAAG